MTITLTLTLPPDEEAWLHAHIACGEFASLEAAAHALLSERIAERAAKDRRDRREVLLAGELSDADLAAIAETEMDARHQHLDRELE